MRTCARIGAHLCSLNVVDIAAKNAVAEAAGVAPKKVETARAVEAEAPSIELEQIKQMRESGRISGADARELRNEVYVLQMGLEAR